MNDRRLTDARLTSGLRAHLAARPDPGLHGRIVAAIELTPQVRPRPSLAGVFADTGVLAGRRGLLVAAALLVGLLIATGAIAGAMLRLQHHDPIPELDLTRPDDLDAYVSNAYLGVLDLPALRIVMSDGDTWYHDGAGTVRQDRPGDGGSGVTWIYSPSRTVEIQHASQPEAWVVSGPAGIDPRAVIFREMACCGVNPACDTGWRYVGLEYVIGRPTHHLSCGFELWFDVELGIPLRGLGFDPTASQPATSQGPGPSPADVASGVVVLDVGPQPSALFADNPDGLPVLTAEERQCALDSTCVSPEPTPAQHTMAPPHATVPLEPPADLGAFVADVRTAHRRLRPLEMIVDSYASPPQGVSRSRHLWDGHGNSRDESLVNGAWEVAWLHLGDRAYEYYAGRWHDYGPGNGDVFSGWTLGLPDECVPGWQHRGFDMVMGRPAHHLVCGLDEFWVDDGWRLVVRTQTDPDALSTTTSVDEVVEVTFAEQPASLFELPEGADVFCPRCRSPAP